MLAKNSRQSFVGLKALSGRFTFAIGTQSSPSRSIRAAPEKQNPVRFVPSGGRGCGGARLECYAARIEDLGVVAPRHRRYRPCGVRTRAKGGARLRSLHLVSSRQPDGFRGGEFSQRFVLLRDVQHLLARAAVAERLGLAANVLREPAIGYCAPRTAPGIPMNQDRIADGSTRPRLSCFNSRSGCNRSLSPPENGRCRWPTTFSSAIRI
jgi:hypothetical protein